MAVVPGIQSGYAKFEQLLNECEIVRGDRGTFWEVFIAIPVHVVAVLVVVVAVLVMVIVIHYYHHHNNYYFYYYRLLITTS